MIPLHHQPLTPRQARFVEEYLLDLNPQAAYERAGYKARGRVAQINACRLLTNANIQATIAEAKAQRSARVQIDQDRVLLEVVRLAFSDIRDYAVWGPDGVTLKDSSTLPDDGTALACLTYTVSRAGCVVIKVKLYDKVKALSLLARHVGLSDATVHARSEGKRGMSILLQERQKARQRLYKRREDMAQRYAEHVRNDKEPI